MTVFNQQGQSVNNQYNAAGDMHFNSIHNVNELIPHLQQLSAEIDQAITTGKIDKETGNAAKAELAKAVADAHKPDAKKTTLVTYLTKAQALLAGITATGGIVEAIKKMVE